MTPYFSILTPTHKRRRYLTRLYNSLESQSFKNFEWIVADDFSDDGTLELLERFLEAAPFEITLLASSAHVGKALLDNRMLDIASGHYILWCDSDDFLHLDTLLNLKRGIESYANNAQLPDLLIATRQNSDSQSYYDSNAAVFSRTMMADIRSDILYNDGLTCFRSALFDGKRFPEVDLYIPEGSVFGDFDYMYVVFTTKPLRFGDYLQDGVSRGGGHIRYSRGLYVEKIVFLSRISEAGKLNYFPVTSVFYMGRLSVHLGYSTHRVLSDLREINLSFLLSYFFIILGKLRGRFDLVFKTIDRTWDVFDVNKRRYKITIYKSNKIN